MTSLLLRLVPFGLAALLLAAPLAVELPADVQDETSENEALASGPQGDAVARLAGVGVRSVRGSFDSTVSSRILSRPPPSESSDDSTGRFLFKHRMGGL